MFAIDLFITLAVVTAIACYNSKVLLNTLSYLNITTEAYKVLK